jgi:hypothetical protein
LTRPLSGAESAGPFSPESWPATINPAKKVHFIDLDEKLSAPGTNWVSCLHFLAGGDHDTKAIEVGGHKGVQVLGIKFNTADDQFPFWAQQHEIDILIQFYGDGVFLDGKGKPRYFNFLTGTLPEPIAVDGGSIPAEANNGKWNWVLFRIPNGLRHMDNGRLVGTIHPKAKERQDIAAVSRLSGQNGGTIRLDGLHDFKVRAVAFGEKGAFGEPGVVNRFGK